MTRLIFHTSTAFVFLICYEQDESGIKIIMINYLDLIKILTKEKKKLKIYETSLEMSNDYNANRSTKFRDASNEGVSCAYL